MSQASGDRSNDVHIMLSDVKRAYFDALARRELYVEVPHEDPGYIEGQCIAGRLRLALYRTRDAAQLFQECLAQHIVDVGLVTGVSKPCVYHRSSRGIGVLVHSDDYASTGTLKELRWMKGQLEHCFDVKTTIVGHGPESDVVREGKILNRVIRASSSGWEYECDQRLTAARGKRWWPSSCQTCFRAVPSSNAILSTYR